MWLVDLAVNITHDIERAARADETVYHAGALTSSPYFASRSCSGDSGRI